MSDKRSISGRLLLVRSAVYCRNGGWYECCNKGDVVGELRLLGFRDNVR
jgi:hypothetical protein